MLSSSRGSLLKSRNAATGTSRHQSVLTCCEASQTTGSSTGALTSRASPTHASSCLSGCRSSTGKFHTCAPTNQHAPEILIGNNLLYQFCDRVARLPFYHCCRTGYVAGCRYIPVGLLERPPQRINEKPPHYVGRNDLETMMASRNSEDWVKIRSVTLMLT